MVVAGKCSKEKDHLLAGTAQTHMDEGYISSSRLLIKEEVRFKGWEKTNTYIQPYNFM